MASMESILRQMSNENTAKTFAFNSQEAQKERDWSTAMSNSSHQREVQDLKRAGLNPVLSSNGGAQAYSASSASGSADSSAVGVLASIYQTKMNNDNAVKLAKLQNENNVQIAKINAAASNYASNNSYAASRYASDVSSANTIYSSDRSFAGHKYGVDRTKYGIVYNTANKFSKGASGKSINSNVSSVGKIVRNAWNTFKKHIR